ncbi:LVIVD repeat-containing protein [Allomuricauda sp. R78024]|uniref:LVIVD repeat-containing protein n=1 Tax=Allomuricauda sp. R78024 TaxID=3093867 RepID=UPI0037C4F6BA
MKKKVLLILSLATLIFVSCDSNDDNDGYADYLVARPLIMSKAEFANGVDIIAPRPIDESGKVYTYEDYIFINDKYQGVHVIDNSNPQQPQKVSFIKIPGNVDISVKDDFLYADSLMDLVVIDISDLNNLNTVNRLENVLYNNIFFPFEADIVEYDTYDYDTEILVGWETVTESRLTAEVEQNRGIGIFDDVALNEASDGGTGQGGSLARFKIVDDYLYAVDSHNINVFDISDLENPEDLEDVYAGFDIETIFNRGNHLFLGSMRGMYIYDISSPATPTFVSEFQHGTACDPVVVDGDYAYVTLRGGNECGALESGLFIVDISDITDPKLAVDYPMDEPYGLGIKDEKLFVCDGSSGLKVYDKTDVEDIKMLNHFKDIVTFDVIPLESHLIMVGDEVLYQYEYLDDEIKLISQIGLN